jgi:hypothetical protein
MFERIRNAITDATGGGPEVNINRLATLVANIDQVANSDEEKLEKLGTATKIEFIVESAFNRFNSQLTRNGKQITTRDRCCSLVVAICDTILIKLGENPMPDSQLAVLDRQSAERVRQGCEIQRKRIRIALLDNNALNIALSLAFEIKTAWRDSSDPRWQVCRITVWETECHEKRYN